MGKPSFKEFDMGQARRTTWPKSMPILALMTRMRTRARTGSQATSKHANGLLTRKLKAQKENF